MSKFKTFLTKTGSALYDLFIASNRWMHAMIGGILMVVMMASIVIWTPFSPIPLQCVFGATVSTLITMCAVEYNDKAHGGKFDWKDIVAGMIVPIVIDIIVILLMIFG